MISSDKAVKIVLQRARNGGWALMDHKGGMDRLFGSGEEMLAWLGESVRTDEIRCAEHDRKMAEFYARDDAEKKVYCEKAFGGLTAAEVEGSA